MKIFKTLLAVILVIFLIAQPALSAPGGNGKGKAKGHDKFEQPKGKHEAKGHKIKDKGLKRGHAIDHGKNQSTEAAASPESQPPRRVGNKHNLETEMQFTLKNLHGVLNKLQHSKWWYNPHPESQDGNMGKPEMLDPYGQNKDDRMELYGTRGRVIRTPIIEPEPEPVPPPPEPEPEPEPTPEPEPEPEPEDPPFTLGG